MRRFWSCVVLGLSTAVVACDNGGTGATTNFETVLNGVFTADIAGTSWTAAGRVIVSEPAGTALILDASSTSYLMRLTMANLVGPGTFLLTASPTNGNVATLTSSAGSWSTANAGGTGTINLTVLTSSRATGTFSFDAPPSAGSSATTAAHVVSGKFDVTF
jgi:hypothetical protein